MMLFDACVKDSINQKIQQVEDERHKAVKKCQTRTRCVKSQVEKNVKIDYPHLRVHPHQEYFIAIATRAPHSFVMLGVMQDGLPKLLARVGKQAAPRTEDFSWFQWLYDIFCGQGSAATLRDESLFFNGDCSYMAYNITYDQYVEFTHMLTRMQEKPLLRCYRPISLADEHSFVELSYSHATQHTTTDNPDEQKVCARVHLINAIDNTCRNSAIDLVDLTLKDSYLHQNISPYFFVECPFSTYFNVGIPKDHFYIFPTPPTSYSHMPEVKRAILEKIYRRMESLLQKDTYSDITISKFNALKELYQEQAGKPDNDLANTLLSIQQWRNKHYDIIKQYRQRSFISTWFERPASTLSMTNELEDMLSCVRS